MRYTYKTRGTCSSQILLDVENGVINEIQFVGGCNGNTKGIAALVKGMKADEVIARCAGIRCGMPPPSCPDQLAKALKEIQKA